jgi:histidyl-tRNA synthetase
MRGFDYYTDIVFEMFDKHPDNNRSMAGGGRYDGLVGLFGVEPVPTAGFAVGDVTLHRFLELHELLPNLRPSVDVAAILIGDVYEKVQPMLAELRKRDIWVAVDATDRKMDTRIKHAEKQGISVVAFIGEKEIEAGSIKFKHLKTGQERELSLDGIDKLLDDFYAEQDA